MALICKHDANMMIFRLNRDLRIPQHVPRQALCCGRQETDRRVLHLGRCFRRQLVTVHRDHRTACRRQHACLDRTAVPRSIIGQVHHWRVTLFGGACAEPGVDTVCFETKNG